MPITIYRKIVKMKYCRKCHGKNVADVEVIAKKYGEDTYINYKTINCPCYVSSQTSAGASGQMQIL